MVEIQKWCALAPCVVCGTETTCRDSVESSDGWAPICAEPCSVRFRERRSISLWLQRSHGVSKEVGMMIEQGQFGATALPGEEPKT